MSEALIIAVVSVIGTVVGSFFGVMQSSRLAIYRINQLETKQDKHNNLIERMVIVEQSTKSAHHRIDELVDDSK